MEERKPFMPPPPTGLKNMPPRPPQFQKTETTNANLNNSYPPKSPVARPVEKSVKTQIEKPELKTFQKPTISEIEPVKTVEEDTNIEPKIETKPIEKPVEEFASYENVKEKAPEIKESKTSPKKEKKEKTEKVKGEKGAKVAFYWIGLVCSVALIGVMIFLLIK